MIKKSTFLTGKQRRRAEAAVKRRESMKKLDIANLERRLAVRQNPEATTFQKDIASDLRKKSTSVERKIEAILQKSGIQYIFQKVIPNETTFYVVDFYFPESRVCLEIDGKYHSEITQYKRDVVRDSFLKLNNYTVIRVKNHVAWDMSHKTLMKIARGKIKPKPRKLPKRKSS